MPSQKQFNHKLNTYTVPKILDSCVKSVMKKGMPRSRAFAICTAQLQKSGVFKKGTQELTDKGKRRNVLSTTMNKKR